MSHILHDLHHELEHTHDLAEKYHYHNIKEIWHALIGKSFKKALRMYALQKEQVLMSYATLHYDIETDIKNPYSNSDNQHVEKGIEYLTNQIDACSRLLTKLLPHGEKQLEIIHHEKRFFVKLIRSFQGDLVDWVAAHEKEIFGSSTLDGVPLGANPIRRGQDLLKDHKAKLDKHITTISGKND